MELNDSRTKVLDIITKKGFKPKQLVTTHGTLIETTQNAKLLGIHISSNLNWNGHVDAVVATVGKRIWMLRQLSYCAPRQRLHMVYGSIIRSVMAYGYPAWCNVTESQISRLYKIEKRVAKIIGDTPTTSLEEFNLKICQRLAHKTRMNNQHLLACVLKHGQLTATRSTRTHILHFARTTRFYNSFIKYA